MRGSRSVLVAGLAASLVVAAGGAARESRARHAGDLGCSMVTAGGRPIASARPSFTGVGSGPFGVAAARGYAFVSNQMQGLDVLADRDSSPHVIHKISLPGQDELGMTITADGRYLLIAGGSGAVVVDVARAESGGPGAVLGMLSNGSSGGGGAIEVATSRDGRYAFVSLEDAGRLAVYRLAAAIADHFSKPSYVGAILTGLAPVGLAISPDGRWLYSTSELARQGAIRPGEAGTLSVISVATAERDPGHAVVATVKAGCQPVRVAVAPDGANVWVTARGSNDLLDFSSQRLLSHAAVPELAAVRVGAAPVGLAVVDGGRTVVVADSDRFDAPGASPGITVVSAAAALARRPAIVGTVRAEQFPRDMTVEPAGTVVLVTNFGSGTLEALHVSDHAQDSRG